ncbi:BT1A1 protein, partial [Himantopus himantopus]|nr:BT1A1 protein [Himantopus himantopus]
LFLAGEVPIIIGIEPSVVLVGEQVTLSCQVTDIVPSDTSVLWYKMEKGKDVPLCSSSSLGGMVEQSQDEEERRIAGHWQGRTLLLVIRQVQVADEGTYVCAVNGSVVTQEATTHLDVTAIGYKPTLDRDMQERGMCRYTCKSKKWYPKPEVIWMNYGGDTVNVEAETNVTLSERDHFTVQSIITVPCDNVDVVCVVKLIKSKISRSGNPCPHCWQQLLPGQPSLLPLLPTLLLQRSSSCKTGQHVMQRRVSTSKVLLQQLSDQESPCWGPVFTEVKSSLLKVSYGVPRRATVGVMQHRQPGKECDLALALKNDIKVDEDTAHPNLFIDVGKKSFTHKSEVQKVSQTERSFDSAICVLGLEGFSSGKHYWEVDVEKSSDWDLGVAGKSAPRKGVISLSPKEQFWALGLSFKDYWARTDPWTRLAVQKNPRKVGVYLNCEEKMLTFFNVTDMSVMFKFKDCAFSEELYPFFKNSH